MAKQKFYAVKMGVEPGIFTSWDECQSSVVGFPGAEYKSFSTWEEAEKYMGEDYAFAVKASKKRLKKDRTLISGNNKKNNTKNNSKKKTKKNKENTKVESKEGVDLLPVEKGKMIAYVDGSYNVNKKQFGYGIVLFTHGRRRHMRGGSADPSLAKFRNVAGEVFGAIFSIQAALNEECDEIDIYHDYTGIECWATKAWKANNKLTQNYQAFCQEAMKTIAINFHKVKAHSGDPYNEAADQLAKEGSELEL